MCRLRSLSTVRRFLAVGGYVYLDRLIDLPGRTEVKEQSVMWSMPLVWWHMHVVQKYVPRSKVWGWGCWSADLLLAV